MLQKSYLHLVKTPSFVSISPTDNIKNKFHQFIQSLDFKFIFKEKLTKKLLDKIETKRFMIIPSLSLPLKKKQFIYTKESCERDPQKVSKDVA